MVGDRQLLLADEPSGALDSANGEAVMRLIRAACKRGVAAVVVTHDAQLASWADRVVFIRDGRVVDQTAPAPGPESLLGQEPGDDRSPGPATALGTGNGGIPARRAVFRWGWRLFRREWRQQLLVLGLLTVAVAATIWGASVVTNVAARQPQLAHVRHRCREGHAARQRSAAWPPTSPTIQHRWGPADVIENQAIADRHQRSLCSCAPRARTGTSTLRCSAWSAARTRPDPVRSR